MVATREKVSKELNVFSTQNCLIVVIASLWKAGHIYDRQASVNGEKNFQLPSIQLAAHQSMCSSLQHKRRWVKTRLFFETFQKFLSFIQQNELSVKVNEGEELKSKLT